VARIHQKTWTCCSSRSEVGC